MTPVFQHADKYGDTITVTKQSNGDLRLEQRVGELFGEPRTFKCVVARKDVAPLSAFLAVRHSGRHTFGSRGHRELYLVEDWRADVPRTEPGLFLMDVLLTHDDVELLRDYLKNGPVPAPATKGEEVRKIATYTRKTPPGNPLGVKKGSFLMSRRSKNEFEVIGFKGSGPERRARLKSLETGRVTESKVSQLNKNFTVL